MNPVGVPLGRHSMGEQNEVSLTQLQCVAGSGDILLVIRDPIAGEGRWCSLHDAHRQFAGTGLWRSALGVCAIEV